MSPPVAVAVVSWNTAELLGRCLSSLAAAAREGLAEAWVVDNGSTDGSQELVRDRFPWVRLEVPGVNLGFGAAVNTVAESSAAPWIAAANADVELRGDALRELIAAGEVHPEAGALAPRLLDPDGSTQHSVHAFPTVGLALLNNLGVHRVSRKLGDRFTIEGAWDPGRAREVDWAHGAFLLLRREAFEAVGGFDTDQWMYAEDLDICWRLRQAGHSVRYVPSAVAVHHASAATTLAFGEARDLRRAAAAYAWMGRRRGRAVELAHAAVSTIVPSVRAAALFLPARIGGGGLAYRYGRARRQAALHRIGLSPARARRESAPPDGTLPSRTDGSDS